MLIDLFSKIALELLKIGQLMTAIKISDMHPAGSDLFVDSESFLSDLSDSEIQIQGGLIYPFITTPVITIITPSFGTPILPVL